VFSVSLYNDTQRPDHLYQPTNTIVDVNY